MTTTKGGDRAKEVLGEGNHNDLALAGKVVISICMVNKNAGGRCRRRWRQSEELMPNVTSSQRHDKLRSLLAPASDQHTARSSDPS
jgi:hypothetical protein